MAGSVVFGTFVAFPVPAPLRYSRSALRGGGRDRQVVDKVQRRPWIGFHGWTRERRGHCTVSLTGFPALWIDRFRAGMFGRRRVCQQRQRFGTRHGRPSGGPAAIGGSRDKRPHHRRECIGGKYTAAAEPGAGWTFRKRVRPTELRGSRRQVFTSGARLRCGRCGMAAAGLTNAAKRQFLASRCECLDADEETVEPADEERGEHGRPGRPAGSAADGSAAGGSSAGAPRGSPGGAVSEGGAPEPNGQGSSQEMMPREWRPSRNQTCGPRRSDHPLGDHVGHADSQGAGAAASCGSGAKGGDSDSEQAAETGARAATAGGSRPSRNQPCGARRSDHPPEGQSPALGGGGSACALDPFAEDGDPFIDEFWEGEGPRWIAEPEGLPGNANQQGGPTPSSASGGGGGHRSAGRAQRYKCPTAGGVLIREEDRAAKWQAFFDRGPVEG